MKDEKQWVQIKDIPYLYLDFSIFEGEIKDVTKNILNIKQSLITSWKNREINVLKEFRPNKIPVFTHYKDYEEIKIKLELNWEGERNIIIEVFRKETDEEFKIRLEQNKKRSESAKKAAINRKLSQEKREKSLLKTLKEKYERVNK